MRVEIVYCVPCGLLDRAVETQRHLLETFGRRLEGVDLTTGHGGVFKVRVGDEEILDSRRQGFDLGEITAAIEGRLPDA